MEGEGCSYVGFFDLQGNKWAESRNPILAITPEQIRHIVNAIASSNTVDLRASGAKLGTRKFICVFQDENVVVLKQLGGDADDKLMVSVGRFFKGCVVGAAPGGEREKCSRISVEKYTEYLKSINY
ncbi:hypothetical protein C0Q70_02897 [Pomacea canaliculata]|uniref:Profilin n=1 Tax=Pomacea canaliculata TaxID=400727 RepID=A0A2T7PR87_POMCA|nr:hypothetical protein C0Q70_02897 [Pomacea canaliculata]